MSTDRPLTERERALILAVITHLAPKTATALSAQLATATASSDDVATLLEIDVPDRAETASIEDGPLPVRALLTSGDGEIMIWVADGRLTGLEFAWVTDEAPEAWPSPDELSFHRVSGP